MLKTKILPKVITFLINKVGYDNPLNMDCCINPDVFLKYPAKILEKDEPETLVHAVET